MRKRVTLITGAAGEIGQALISNLAERSQQSLITLDIQPLPGDSASKVTHIQGDIMDKGLLSRLVSEYEIDTIYHLGSSIVHPQRVHASGSSPNKCRRYAYPSPDGYRAI